MIVGGMKEDDAIISISGEINSAKNGSIAKGMNIKGIEQLNKKQIGYLSIRSYTNCEISFLLLQM
jgi:hypothetical protein